MKHFIALILIFLFAVNLTAQTISVSTSTTNQTFSGWEATVEMCQHDCPASFDNYRNQLYDDIIELGINRLRLEIKMYYENDSPVTTGAVNDNGDPNSMNGSGFQFAKFDKDVEDVVIPIRNKLLERGEDLYLVVCYVDFRSSAYEPHDDPNEFAEFFSVFVNRLALDFNITPDAIETILEPDNGSNSDWSTTMLADNTNAAITRLHNEGYTNIKAIIPSTTQMPNMDDWYDGAVSNGLTKSNVVSCGYHRYVSNDSTLAATIANCLSDGKTIGMNEWIGASVDELHTDLTTGMNSFWQQFTLAGPTSWGPDIGDRYFIIDESNPSSPIITMADRTKLLRQYFKFIRRGAIRYAASSSNGNLKPTYFINTNGTHVVAIRATTNVSNFTVGGLPAGTYKIKYTTASAYDQNLSDVTIGSGQNITTSIPAAGVLTIYQNAPAQASAKQKFFGKTVFKGKGKIK